MTKQPITLFIILTLLTSMLSVALTSSEQVNPSFGEESKGDKPKETKSDSKPKKEAKPKDKPKDDAKSKDDNTKSKGEDKTKEEEKPKDEIITKDNDNNKKHDTLSTSNDNPSTPSTSDTSIKPPTSDSDVSSTSSTDPNNPTTPTTLSSAASVQQPVVTNPTQPLSNVLDKQPISQSSVCGPTNSLCPLPNPTTTPNDIMQQPCDPTKMTCPPVTNLNGNTRCPADFRIGSDGLCHVISCTLPKEKCPPPCDLKKGECSKGIKCNPNYHRGSDGLCHIVNSVCTLPKEKCPPPVCDLFTKKCYWNINCKNNSTEQSCDKDSNKNNNENNGSDKTDSVIKFYITNPIIQQQVAQQPSNALIPMDTLQFCNLIGDQACVFMNGNFKILFNHTSKDNLGNWVLNGEAQNIGANPLNNVMVVWHLYDAFGNMVGVTQGYPIPSSLGIGQTTIFNLQETPTSLTGIPKFYRVSFVF